MDEPRNRSLVGLDFSSIDQRTASRKLGPAMIALLIAAIGLVALRTEVIKLRYELAEIGKRERTLDQQQRDLQVRVRQLRNPQLLAIRAEELGFRRPDRLIDVPSPGAADRQLANLPLANRSETRR